MCEILLQNTDQTTCYKSMTAARRLVLCFCLDIKNHAKRGLSTAVCYNRLGGECAVRGTHVRGANLGEEARPACPWALPFKIGFGFRTDLAMFDPGLCQGGLLHCRFYLQSLLAGALEKFIEEEQSYFSYLMARQCHVGACGGQCDYGHFVVWKFWPWAQTPASSTLDRPHE